MYIVRHAEAPFIFGKEKEREISENGHKKSKEICHLFKSINIDYIVSSSYSRAVQTVQYLADDKGLDIEKFEELRERHIKGLDYKMEWSEIEEGIKQSFEDIDFAFEGGETTHEAQERSIPIVLRLLRVYQGKSLVMGTHGNIMTIILKYFDHKYGYEFWKCTTKPDVYKLTFSNSELIDVERLWNTQ